MNGLPQARKIAHDLLVLRLSKNGYALARKTPRLWISRSKNITFTLVVDDFGAKNFNKKSIYHLSSALKDKHTIIIDKTGSL